MSDPVGFNLDFDQVLRDLTKTKRRRTRPATNDMDAAVRRAVRAEMDDVERTLKALVAEVARLRRANEELADKVARLAKR
jgi:predicted RNase H-like nuclease (RuvC/YqgF family)